MATDHCMCLACKRTCTHTYSVCHVYEQCTNVVHTVYVLTLCIQITGFRGSRRDQDKQAGGPVSTKPPDTDDDERDGSPCRQDEEFFQGGPDADAMEEAITNFLDGLEGQERSGFKDLHRFLGRLPCPTVEKVGQSMSHTQALHGGFLPNMDAEQQKRFTPSELLLYRHALEYRYL